MKNKKYERYDFTDKLGEKDIHIAVDFFTNGNIRVNSINSDRLIQIEGTKEQLKVLVNLLNEVLL